MTAPSYSLAWSIAKETNLPRFTGLAISVVNTGGFLGTALITTAMGVILDRTAGLAAVAQYRSVFTFCLACSILSLACATLLQDDPLPEHHDTLNAGTGKTKGLPVLPGAPLRF